ncbi:MAG: hypothetical protein MR846_00585 [Tenericutes bacterium]|nr:hypothetical protein [Mycoplasmatota bacterium]
MKKKLLFAIAACALFLPATVFAAADPTYDEEVKAVFANGTPITVEERTDGEAGALIKWEGGELAVPANTSVFGGSHDNATKVESTSITVNGGTLYNIFGGGLHKSYVGTARVTVTGGTINGKIHGGGASSYAGSTCHQPWYDGDKENATTVVDEAIVTIKGGNLSSATDVFGAGEGISYTKKATLTITKEFTGNIRYATAGGSNGYTDDAKVFANGGKIKVLQAVNRGFIETSEMTVDGAEVEKAYASAEGDDQELGVTDSAKLVVISGKVGYAAPGQKGNPGQKANEISTIVYNDGTVTTVEDFDEDATTVTVTLMLIAEDEEQTIQIPKGTVFTDEELKAMIEEINNELAADNLELVGFYLDEESTQEFDFSTPIEQDMELYMKLKAITPEQKVENPETSDVNIFLILSLVAVGAFGTTLVLKNRLS